jgi:hypothetical protein
LLALTGAFSPAEAAPPVPVVLVTG